MYNSRDWGLPLTLRRKLYVVRKKYTAPRLRDQKRLLVLTLTGSTYFTKYLTIRRRSHTSLLFDKFEGNLSPGCSQFFSTVSTHMSYHSPSPLINHSPLVRRIEVQWFRVQMVRSSLVSTLHKYTRKRPKTTYLPNTVFLQICLPSESCLRCYINWTFLSVVKQ